MWLEWLANHATLHTYIVVPSDHTTWVKPVYSFPLNILNGVTLFPGCGQFSKLESILQVFLIMLIWEPNPIHSNHWTKSWGYFKLVLVRNICCTKPTSSFYILVIALTLSLPDRVHRWVKVSMVYASILRWILQLI